MSRVIHVFTVEGHDVVQHAPGLDGGTIGVELGSTYVAVDGLMPLLPATGLVALLVEPLSLKCVQFFHLFNFFFAAARVFFMSEQMVIGPTPPGTGVM